MMKVFNTTKKCPFLPKISYGYISYPLFSTNFQVKGPYPIDFVRDEKWLKTDPLFHIIFVTKFGIHKTTSIYALYGPTCHAVIVNVSRSVKTTSFWVTHFLPLRCVRKWENMSACDWLMSYMIFHANKW